ncbi:MAG TPA: hypothetical protein VKO84_03915 [Gaiellaceae bacterium]|nr:hypothetical protein [Gaiellaceae bacterium]
MDVIASFLTGSILTLVLPVGLLLGIVIWWIAVLRRRGDEG